MKKAIQSILTGIGGSLSSKRVGLFLFIFAFFTECGMSYGGFKLDPTLMNQLFYTLQVFIVTVFGESAIPAIKGAIQKYGPPDIGLPSPETK